MILAESGIYTLVDGESYIHPTNIIFGPFDRDCQRIACDDCIFSMEDLPCNSLYDMMQHQAFHKTFPNFIAEYPEYSI